MDCKNCGAAISQNVKSCTYCGSAVDIPIQKLTPKNDSSISQDLNSAVSSMVGDAGDYKIEGPTIKPSSPEFMGSIKPTKKSSSNYWMVAFIGVVILLILLSN